ncbi:MAG: hypothetical protein RL477_1010, partial [Pseudomonadota bacterium]
PGNFVTPARLDRPARARLKEALRTVDRISAAVGDSLLGA